MKTTFRMMARLALTASLACMALPSTGARSVHQKKLAASKQFETAQHLREALDARPESARSRRDYQRVIAAYRKVYYTAPSSRKADTAVLAVAELLDEQGSVLNDPKSFKDSIGQLAFLRREYPGSKYRVAALFTIGEIFRDDLDDYIQAKAAFQDYLKRYPHSRLAPEARRAVRQIAEAEAPSPFDRKRVKLTNQVRGSPLKAAWAAIAPPEPPGDRGAAGRAPAKSLAKASNPWRGREAGGQEPIAPSASVETSAAQVVQDVSLASADAPLSRHMPRLTSVRHWSTPDYTRVAIDLDQEVQYQVGRVPHPDRIFFDLIGTRLAPDLVGKSFDVEAGFLHRIRVAQFKPNMARVVLDVDDVAEYSAFLLPNPYRLIIDIHGKLPVRQVAALKPRTAIRETATEHQPPAVSIVAAPVKPAPAKLAQVAPASAARSLANPAGPAQSITGNSAAAAKVEPLKISADDTGDDTSMDVPAPATSKPTTGPTFQTVAPRELGHAARKIKERGDVISRMTGHVAAPTASGDRSLIRALGLKIGKIVIDAGHGGHDTGTIGPNGLMEKDLVLDVALRLGKLLESRLGAEVVYTRDDDTFIPLETRTAIANKEQADLFISIHANSSRDPSARGVETYYLNFTTSRDALAVAARENAVSEASIHQLQDLVKKIALTEKIEESRELAADVQHSLYVGLNSRNPGERNRGVKKAPFVVLIGANMPSILAEISFVSNPSDEKKLKTGAYRQRIAASLYQGIHKYVSGLSGVKVASKLEEDESTKGVSAVADVK